MVQNTERVATRAVEIPHFSVGVTKFVDFPDLRACGGGVAKNLELKRPTLSNVSSFIVT